ncbi:hypothetical protein ES703_92406 [subsurface metagenome]
MHNTEKTSAIANMAVKLISNFLPRGVLNKKDNAIIKTPRKIKTGKYFFVLFSLSSGIIKCLLIIENVIKASIPLNTGDITHDMTICPTFDQETVEYPFATIPTPISTPIIEWVVETGNSRHVAIKTHKEAPTMAASKAVPKIFIESNAAGLTIPFLIV